MTVHSRLVIVPALTIVAALATVAAVRADASKVAFPASYAQGVVYMTQDRPDNKQVRDYYTGQAAIDAAKRGGPLPDGTIIAVVQYAAQLDAMGNPVKDANGHFIKTNNIVGYTVMEKEKGWGADYPDTKRNGEWEYRVFRADKTPNTNANLDSCFGCHQPQAANDYVYTYDKLKAAAH